MKTKLYLIPGTMCTKAIWQGLLPYLDDEFELCYLNIPNHMSLDEITDDICGQFDEVKVNLIGFSLGGYIASLLACRFPNKINKLMVIANSPCALNTQELLIRQKTVSILQNFGYKGMPRIKAQALLANKEKQHVDLMLAMDKELGVNTLMSQLDNTSKREDLMGSLVYLESDVHFIYSQEDALINIDWMTKLEGLTEANMTQKVYQGKSHMLTLEQPDNLALDINRFFNQDKKADP